MSQLLRTLASGLHQSVVLLSKLGRRGLLLCLLLVHSPPQAAELLRISFTDKPPGSGEVYSSASAAPIPELRVMSGSTVKLRGQRGDRYEAEAGGWHWTQVQQVPADANAISITPQLQGEKVVLEITIIQRHNDRASSYSSTVVGPLGQWLTVLGPERQAKPGAKVYGAGSATASSQFSPRGLFLRVDAVLATN